VDHSERLNLSSVVGGFGGTIPPSFRSPRRGGYHRAVFGSRRLKPTATNLEFAMIRFSLALALVFTSLMSSAGQNPPVADPAKSEKEKLVEVCRTAWRQTTTIPKGLKAEGTFSTFLNENEVNRATFVFAAKGERYRADMTFEAGNFPRPNTKMVVLRDPGVVFSGHHHASDGPERTHPARPRRRVG